MNFVLFILVCFGITNILARGRIFDNIRPKHHYFHCVMCLGFIVGILVFIGFWFSEIYLFTNPYLGSFFFGCISSAISFILAGLFNDDGIHINIS